jgi:hypothetical protein
MNVSSDNSAAILNPAQASVTRRVKERGFRIAIGQSAALVEDQRP